MKSPLLFTIKKSSIKHLTQIKFQILLIFIIGLTSSCNITKHLQDDELLISKTKFKYEKTQSIKKEKQLKKELELVVIPKPDRGPLKIGTGIYQWADKKEKKKGFRKWLQRNLGKAPAIYDEREQVRNQLRLKKILKDNGFLNSNVEVDTLVKGKKIEMTYHISTKGQYQINQIILPSDTTNIGKLIHQNQKESLLQKGKFYSELNLTNERIRIQSIAAQQGYIDFNQQYLYYFVDTLPNQYLADIYIQVKPPKNTKEHQQFRLGKTKVYPNYDLSNNSLTDFPDTVVFKEDFYIFEDYHLLDYKVLDKMILQNEGDVLSKRFQDASVSHLLDLGIFKFVNLKYERTTDSLYPTVNRSYYLTPSDDQNLSSNFEVNNRTGKYYGIGVSGSYTHRNLFKKAYLFRTTLSGNTETQSGTGSSLLNTFDLNFQTSLSIPRFILPFKIKENLGLFVPRTTVEIGNNFQRRLGLYSINSSNFKWGYQWKETSEKQHYLYPINLNRLEVLNKTEDFETFLDENPRLANSFKNLFIGGLDYTYIFTNQTFEQKKDYWFFRGNLRTSGNLLHLAATTFGFSKGEDGKYELLSLPYAQFTSLEADLRYYKQLNNQSSGKAGNTLAFRFFPAIGFAYGNSSVLPYTEQFFVGGSNSIRAFEIRTLGPGSYVPEDEPDDVAEEQFLDQTGDIKIEMSAEYRFGILGVFKGAAFVDAGNIWLLNDDSIEGGKFEVNNFLNEIAIGAGLGLRLDFQYVVLRFDVGVPLRRPYYGEGFQWTFDRFDIGSSSWRSDNLNGSIAVGYPF